MTTKEKTIEQTCLNCKTKYTCSFKSDYTHSCEDWADHFSLVEVTLYPKISYKVIKQFFNLHDLKNYSQTELNLVWVKDSSMAFNGFFKSSSHSFIIHEIK